LRRLTANFGGLSQKKVFFCYKTKMNIEAQFAEGTPHIPLDPKEKEQLDFEEDDEDLCDKNLDDGDEKSKKKKRSYKKRNHYCPTIAEIKQTFHLPLEQAAQTFNICVSKLKKLCREHGITRWPYRKVTIFFYYLFYRIFSNLHVH